MVKQRDAKAMYNLVAQDVQNVAGVEQRDLSMGWRRVCHHLTHRNQDPYIVAGQEKPSDEAILDPDGGHRPSLLNEVFCSPCQRALLNHLQSMLR